MKKLCREVQEATRESVEVAFVDQEETPARDAKAKGIEVWS